MQIIHVYNNNIVSAIRGKQEMIIVGAGIGFHKRPGDTVDEKRIEKTYTFEDEQKKQLHMLLERTPILYFRIAEVIARKACETLKIEVSPQLLISLSDHIHYAAERKKQNINVPNFMLNEIKTLYKREFKVGLWALKLIQANTEISFPEDEAGYIAMHIVNATLNNGGRSSNVSKILRFIKDVQRIVEETYQVHLDENELNFSRFITHLKFLGQHMFSNQMTKKEELGDLYAFLIKRNDKMEHCIHQIRETIKEKYHYELQENEQVYLMIHIGKLID